MSALEKYYQARYNRFRALINWSQYIPGLIKAVNETLPDAEVYIFGSALKGELTANSDIDVLIVSESVAGRQRHKIAVAIEERLENPVIFEMHFVTRDKVEWYRRHVENLVSAEKIARGEYGNFIS